MDYGFQGFLETGEPITAVIYLPLSPELDLAINSTADTAGRVIGTAGSDTLTATSGTTTFDGHGAPAGLADFMIGLGGQDTFIFNTGYGVLDIKQDDNVYTNPPTLANVLQFGPGISLPQIKVSATRAGDLILVMGSNGDLVKLDGEVGADPSIKLGVQKVAFADGSSITRQQLNSLAHPDLLFDANFYLARNPDVAASGTDPYLHYLTYGWKEGRNPDALFNTNYYLAQNPDVKAAGADPLLQYVAIGQAEGRTAFAA